MRHSILCPECVLIATEHQQQGGASSSSQTLFPMPTASAPRDGYSISAREVRCL